MIYELFKCSKCGFEAWTPGSSMYVTNAAGERIIYGEDHEWDTVKSVLGEDAPKALIKQRTGTLDNCLCLACLNEFQIDLDRDQKTCPKCGSSRIDPLDFLFDGSECPKCKEGTLQKINELIT